MKSLAVLAFSSAMLIAAPAFAQAAAPAPATQSAAPAAGATVLDPQGGTVGTIESVNAQGVVVSTGSVKVTLPLNSFAAGPKGPTIALTKAQLEQQAQAAQAQASASIDSKLVAGAPVAASDGANVGTIKASAGDLVTVTTAKGDVQLPKAAFAPADSGVRIGMTGAQFQAAVSGAAGASTPAAGGAATPAEQ